MNRKEKSEKKGIISSAIDLSNGRYKDNEIDTLMDLVENRDNYDGRSETYKHRFTDWSSDGKYTREEETTYTFRSDDDGIRIEEHYEHHDDDGDSGERNYVHNTGRDILNVLGKVFKN